jgi:hypothetical protein
MTMRKYLLFLITNFITFASIGQELTIDNLADSARIHYVKILKKDYSLSEAKGTLTASVINDIPPLNDILFFKVEYVSSAHTTMILIIPVNRKNGQQASVNSFKEFNDIASSYPALQKYDRTILYLILSNPLNLFNLIVSIEDSAALSTQSFLIKYLPVVKNTGNVPRRYLTEKKQIDSRVIINYTSRPNLKFNQYVFLFNERDQIIKIKTRTHSNRYSIHSIRIVKE